MCVCLFARILTNHTSKLIFGTRSLLAWLDLFLMTVQQLRYVLPVFVNDVIFAQKRPGKDDANSAYAQSDSPGSEPGAKCDVYDCLVWYASFRFSCEGLQRYSGIDMVKRWIGQKRLGTAAGLTGFDMRSFSSVDRRDPFGYLVQDRLTILILFCHPTNNIKSH